jgi:hypothetical protein
MPPPAPQQRRRGAEIVKAALAVLKPPVDAREVVRAHLRDDISLLREYAEAETERSPRPLPGELKQQMAESRTALLKAKRTLVRWPRPLWAEVQERRQLIELLSREVERLQAHQNRILVRRSGGKQPDPVKWFAAECAAAYFRSDELKLTDTRPWYGLSTLFYEAATGKADQDLMHVLRQMDHKGITRVRAPPWLRARVIGFSW